MPPPLPDDWRDCLEEPGIREAQETVLEVLRDEFAQQIANEGPSRLGLIARGATAAGVLPLLHVKQRKETRGSMRILLEGYLRSPTFPVEVCRVLLTSDFTRYLLDRMYTETRASLLRLAFAHRKAMLERELPACIAGRSTLGLLECQERIDTLEERYRYALRLLYTRA